VHARCRAKRAAEAYGPLNEQEQGRNVLQKGEKKKQENMTNGEQKKGLARTAGLWMRLK
jgi:hypothetical protein